MERRKRGKANMLSMFGVGLWKAMQVLWTWLGEEAVSHVCKRFKRCKHNRRTEGHNPRSSNDSNSRSRISTDCSMKSRHRKQSRHTQVAPHTVLYRQQHLRR